MRRFVLLAVAVLTWASPAFAAGKLGEKLGPAHPWLKVELGLSFADLHAFRGKYPAPEGAAVGGVVGAEAAVRWKHLSIGLTGRFHPLTEFNMYQIAPYVGLHLPQDNYDLSATAHVGYTVADGHGAAGVVAKGAYTGVILAFDYLVKAPLLIGVGVGSDVLFLGDEPKRSNVGVGFTGALRLGLLL